MVKSLNRSIGLALPLAPSASLLGFSGNAFTRSFSYDAAVVTERELGQEAVEMLTTHEVVDAIHLPLEERPSVPKTAGVDGVVFYILADEVVHGVIMEPLADPTITPSLIRHHIRERCYVGVKLGIQGFGRGVWNHFCPQLAIALQHAHNGHLVRPALAAWRALVGVLVLLLAADVGLIGFHHAF